MSYLAILLYFTSSTYCAYKGILSSQPSTNTTDHHLIPFVHQTSCHVIVPCYLLTLFGKEVDNGIELAGPVKVSHLTARLQTEVLNADTPLAAAWRVQQRHLHKHSLLLRQFVIVFHFQRHCLFTRTCLVVNLGCHYLRRVCFTTLTACQDETQLMNAKS